MSRTHRMGRTATLLLPLAGVGARVGHLVELGKRFAAAATNRGGRLSREQALAGMPRVAKNVDPIDF